MTVYFSVVIDRQSVSEAIVRVMSDVWRTKKRQVDIMLFIITDKTRSIIFFYL